MASFDQLTRKSHHGNYTKMEINFEAIPLGLRERNQWVCWKEINRDGKKTKVPFQPDGSPAKSNDSTTWSSFDNVQKTSGQFDGVGFVFSQDDGLFGVDLDSCVHNDGSLTTWAQDVVDQCHTYCEISPSGTGVKLIGRGRLPNGSVVIKDGLEQASPSKNPEIACYESGRYFCLTGCVYGGMESIQAVEFTGSLRDRLQGQPGGFETKKNPPKDSSDDAFKAAIQACLKIPVVDGGDGSSRLLAYCRQAKRFLASEWDCLRLVRAMEAMSPFPKKWSNEEILKRIRTARVDHESGLNPPGPMTGSSDFSGKTSNVSTCQRNEIEFEPFPIECLPACLGVFCLQVGRAACCDPVMAALPLLCGLASAVGNTAVLKLKSTWMVPSVLWGCIVARSGSVKSHPPELALRPLHDAQSVWIRDHKELMEEFKQEKELFKRDLAQWQKGKTPDDLPPCEPCEPMCRRSVVNDITIESLAKRLAANPRGVLAAYDELAGWFSSFERYSATSDVGKWLEFYSARKVVVDRASTSIPLVVDRAAVSLFGTIQPAILAKHLTSEHRSSGLAARILFVAPPSQQKIWNDFQVEQSIMDCVSEIYAKLLAVEMTPYDDGTLSPQLVIPDSDAMESFIRFYNRHNVEHQLIESNDLLAASAKLEETAARLALVIHCARYALGECPLWQMDQASMDAGIRLAEWFKRESLRVYSMLSGGVHAEFNLSIVTWIKQAGRVTSRDLQRKYPRQFKSVDDAESKLREMVGLDLLASEVVKNPSGPAYTVFFVRGSI